MAICCFNGDCEKKYECEYEIDSDGITVSVCYCISKEIAPDLNGAKIFSGNTNFEKRDILIVDSKLGINYLLKNAYYIGHNEIFGTLDDGSFTKFYSNCYFYHEEYDSILKLLKTPEISKIRIYSNIFNDFVGTPSLFEDYNGDEFVIKLKKQSYKEIVKIDSEDISNIILSDNWVHRHNYELSNISIDIDGYAEIELKKRKNYDLIHKYIMELILYIQLYRPDKTLINKITVCVNDIYYGFSIPLRKLHISKNMIQNSVSEDFSTFVSKCYAKLSYSNANNEIRNIPYIIFDYSRNLEDTFLMLYRTIECYYKRNGKESSFINYSVVNNYNGVKNLLYDDIELLTAQIISLRNHYVHSGYFIKNNSLKIEFKRLKRKKANPKDYIDKNVDFEWIYDKTKILYSIVIDIVFKNMLGFDYYNFAKKI